MPPDVTRRRFLGLGLALGGVGLLAAGAGGLELVEHGVLPGRQLLDRLDGACDVAVPPLTFSPPGESRSGSFYSAARRRVVGYTLAFPPGHRFGDPVALVVMLHGEGGDHRSVPAGMTPAMAVALHVSGAPLPPMAMVTVDGGRGYWHRHRGDDPMAMVLDELLPRCARVGAGAEGHEVGVMGISMGGYGALLLAERHPDRFRAAAAISPAIWTTYAQARAVNAGAFSSAADFAANDVVAHAGALRRTPVRVASGVDDPFHPGVVALARVLPRGTVVDFGPGCHTGAFFRQQQPPSLGFLGTHLVGER